MDHETLLLSLLSTFVSMDYFLSFCHMICLFFAPNPFTTPSAIPLARIAIPVVLVFFPFLHFINLFSVPPAVSVSLKLKHSYVGRFHVFVVFVTAPQALSLV